MPVELSMLTCAVLSKKRKCEILINIEKMVPFIETLLPLSLRAAVVVGVGSWFSTDSPTAQIHRSYRYEKAHLMRVMRATLSSDTGCLKRNFIFSGLIKKKGSGI